MAGGYDKYNEPSTPSIGGGSSFLGLETGTNKATASFTASGQYKFYWDTSLLTLYLMYYDGTNRWYLEMAVL